ncbi:MAG TPA: M48 family metalloprotease [Limnobacter sp.]|nr:M48 family metalloprotease [Limnobacter sp.]
MHFPPLRLWILLLLLPLAGSCSTPAHRDFSDTLRLFEELRLEYEVPYSRMGFQGSPLFAFARGKAQIMIDESFSENLSEPALRYVFVHELVHLKHNDPTRGYDLLKKIHQAQARDTELMDNAFMTLLGTYGEEPEFREFLDEAESRANETAAQHLIARGEDPCKAISEIEKYTGARFRFGMENLCS